MTSSDSGQDATRHLREVIAARRQAAALSYTAPPRPETPAPEAATPTPAVTPLQTTRQTQATVAEQPTAPRRYDTTIANREDIGRVVVFVLRIAMLALYPLSLVGSILAFNGGWDGFGARLFGTGMGLGALIAGLVFQFVLSGIQIWRGATWKDPGYLAALVVDVVLTMWGYWPLFGGGLTTVFTAIVAQVPPITDVAGIVGVIVAFVIMLIGAVLVARLPEQTLFR